MNYQYGDLVKFYEIKEPYYALISAKNASQCKLIYEDMVSDVDNDKEFIENIKVLSITQAIDVLSNGLNEEKEPIGLDDAKIQICDSIISDQATLLLIDGSLL